jgi:creatinine amidohydrolase
MAALSKAERWTWPEFKEALAEGRPAVLPIGAFEQHGPHLPLATDTIIVERLAEEVASATDGFLLPSLAYGALSRPRSGGGDLFPAPALTLPALLATVDAVVQGLIDAGARRLIVLSWHWENANVLWEALGSVVSGEAIRAVLVDNPAAYLDGGLIEALFPEGFPGWESEHAGRLETALVSYLTPELVRRHKAARPFTPRLLDVFPTPSDAVPSDGVFFSPGAVGAEEGRRCFESIAGNLATAIQAEFKESR